MNLSSYGLIRRFKGFCDGKDWLGWVGEWRDTEGFFILKICLDQNDVVLAQANFKNKKPFRIPPLSHPTQSIFPIAKTLKPSYQPIGA